MKLSILICSLDKREEMLSNLLNDLLKQLPKLKNADKIEVGNTKVEIGIYGDIEIIIATDNKQMKVGTKRNLLVRQAKGDYIVFIDDDDRISDDYIHYILKGIQSGLDVINFKVLYNPSHTKSKEVLYSLNYRDSETAQYFYRASNHLMCVKREIALKVPFIDKSFGEDADYAKRLKRFAKSQANIDKVLYFYDFDYAKSETQ